MKIILKYALNNINERKMRTVVMLLSVVLATTLLFVSFSIGDSYSSAQRKMAQGIAGTATISVLALPDAKGEKVWIFEEDVPNLPSIKNKAGIIEAPALYNENGYFENFDMIAADLEKLNRINKPRLLDGDMPHEFSGYQVALPQKFTSKYGIKTGDNVKLRIGGNSFRFRVTAIGAYDTVFLRQNRGFNALIPLDAMRGILGIQKGYGKILIEPGNKRDTDTLISKLTNALSPKTFSINKVMDEKQVQKDAREKSMPFFLISFFASTMSIFIIYSSYKVITIERLPMIGTFRSIGATEKAVVKILMMESFLYGVLGGLLGILLGFGVLKIILGGLGESLSLGIEIPIVIAPVNMMMSFMAAIFVSILSAWIPVKRASKLPIKEVVLGKVEEKIVSNPAKLGFGLILLILTLILPRIASGQMLILAGGFSLLGFISATMVVVPTVITGFSSLMERVYGRVLGNEGQLAARNMKGNKNINQNITLLIISISAVITISVVTSFVSTYIGDVFKGASLDGFADASMNEAFVQKVKSIGGMKAVLPIHVLEDNILIDGKFLERMEAVEDLSLYNAMLAIKYDSENIRNDLEAYFHNGRNILLSSDFICQRGIKVGDTIRLSYIGTQYKYHVAGSYKSRASGATAIIPSSCAVNDFNAKDYGLMAFKAADAESAMIQIRDLFSNKTNWSRTVKEFNADVSGVVGAFLQPLRKLTYFILMLAAIGIINNLLINYYQKRRFIAMYKSVGLSNRQNIKISLIEGFSCGLMGAIFGIIVSYLEIKTIFLVAGPRTSMEPQLEASVFVMAGTIGIVITLMGSIVPILKGSQMKIVEEIKFE